MRADLATHLSHGPLIQDGWNFCNFRCGTTGCAIGECEGLFKDVHLGELLKVWNDSREMRRSVDQAQATNGIIRWGMDKFGITEDLFDYFFVPKVDADINEHSWLTEYARPSDVGDLISHYLAYGQMLVRSEEETDTIANSSGAVVRETVSNNPYHYENLR